MLNLPLSAKNDGIQNNMIQQYLYHEDFMRTHTHTWQGQQVTSEAQIEV